MIQLRSHYGFGAIDVGAHHPQQSPYGTPILPINQSWGGSLLPVRAVTTWGGGGGGTVGTFPTSTPLPPAPPPVFDTGGTLPPTMPNPLPPPPSTTPPPPDTSLPPIPVITTAPSTPPPSSPTSPVPLPPEQNPSPGTQVSVGIDPAAAAYYAGVNKKWWLLGLGALAVVGAALLGHRLHH